MPDPFTFTRSKSVGQIPLAQDREHLRRKRLVQLDEVHVVHAQPGPLQRAAGRRDGTDAHRRRLHAGDRPRLQPRERLKAQLRRLLGVGDDADRGGVVLTADAFPAVTVASRSLLAISARRVPSRSSVVSARACSSRSISRSSPRLLTATGTISEANVPLSWAASARWCERSASSSCSEREIP